MARIPRGIVDGDVLHILNRGNARAALFVEAGDYRSFIRLLGRALKLFEVRVQAFAVMPNHFHLVGQVASSAELSAFMQWWMTSHVRHHHRRFGSSGHLWQGRFKSFPIQQDEHFLTVARYVLLNPVRALLARSPMEWPWTSLRFPELTVDWPVNPPRDVASWLADGVPAAELKRVRESIARRRPYGAPAWQEEVARASGLESTLRPRGRPPGAAPKSSLSPF